MDELLPSLVLLSDRISRERDQQQRHADALDTKAGLLLGFAGLLAALPRGGGSVGVVGRCLAVVASGLCLCSLFPRPFSALEMLAVREQYLTSQADFTRLELLDADIAMSARDGVALRAKARYLKIAFVVLTLATVVLTGAILDVAGGIHG